MTTSTILIIDDTLENIQLAFNVLRQNPNYKILYAQSGERGIAMLEEHKVDLILLDIRMPGLDGFETCKIIKSNPATEKIPVLFLSADGDSESINKAFDLGGEDYITKPFNPRELINRTKTHIELYLNRKKLEDDLDSNQKLLEQYKKIVDISNIVSKTDKNGLITYANKKFCDVSGYTEEELLGRSHNIIRHPDVTKSFYHDLWKTIYAKNVWQGIIRNQSKDGKSYYVDSFIMPILNRSGEIDEFISVRHDVTEIFELKDEFEMLQKEMILKIAELGESRCQETGQHVERVAKYSYLLALLYGLPQKECEILKEVSPLHDIGKVAIPDGLLLKPGRLCKEEFEIIKLHAQIGGEIFEKSKHAIFQAAAIVAKEHHEKWNGTGYPKGKKGEEIHIFGRIVAIADVYDALIHDRVYKRAWSEEAVLSFFEEQCGEHFDPSLCRIFLDNYEQFKEIKDRYSAVESYPTMKKIKNKD